MFIESVSQIYSNNKNIIILLAVILLGYACSVMLLDSPVLFGVMMAYAVLSIFFQNRLKVALYFYLFTVFFIPPTIGIQTPYILLNADRLVLIILLSSWAIMLLRRKLKVYSTPIDVALFVYISVTMLSLLWNIDKIAGYGQLAVSIKKISTISLERILIIYVIASILGSRAEIKRMLLFIIACLSIVAAYGIFESIVRDNIFLHIKTIDNPEVVGTAFSEAIRFGMYRAKSTQMLPHILGTALSMILPLELFYLLHTKGRERLLAALATPLTLGGIAVTYTRGVYMACGLGMFLAFIALKNISKKMMFAALIGCILFVALSNQRVVMFCSEYFAKLLNPETAAFDRENSIQSRVSDYTFASNRLKNQMVLGQGYGTYDAGVGLDQYLDNAYLYVILETGIIGFAAFLFLIYNIIFKLGRMLMKYQRQDEDIYMSRFIHIGLIVFFFQCLTYDAFVFAGASKLFWVLLGLMLSMLRIAEMDADGKVYDKIL